MDFIIIYSKYSHACVNLFELYPSLQSKGVCVDEKQLRLRIMKDLNITVVPTLLVVDTTRIIQRIIGLENIKIWLWATSTQIDTIRAEVDTPTNIETTELRVPSNEHVTSLDVESGNAISQSDVEILPSQDINYSLKSSVSIKSVAEEMQRERESFMDDQKKNRR